MKSTFLFALLIPVLLIATCKGGSSPTAPFSTPESTFETMVTAIKAKDLDTYTQCWYPERLERESEVNKIKQDPSAWDELGALFKGSPKIKEIGELSESGKTVKKFHIASPEGHTISMIKDGEKWLMYSW
ncbi:MAG: hypothetical protein RLZZ519_786 [Bacteroidota bacterium]|jgi:hypothetical protein